MNFAAARRNMVDSQLRTNRVNDPAVLEAFSSVPREIFVPAERQALAYVDDDLPIAPGRFLMEPMVLARLVQLAEPEASDRALDVACATGYATAILSRLAGRVVGVEDQPALAHRARDNLVALGVANAVVCDGDPTLGWPQEAPYDVILIDGMVEIVPQALIDQLGEGGRMVYVQRRDGVG
ncbi:MAG: protein-L-isoaspartate O-methyltransferase, partial [Rhodospirillaceae bacterium]|nr:protein-L-isoaspartate O-methyltransferase [Rhodospirillaceae bacterium]